MLELYFELLSQVSMFYFYVREWFSYYYVTTCICVMTPKSKKYLDAFIPHKKVKNYNN